MNKHWVTFSWSYDTEGFDPIRAFLEKHGCEVSHRHMDGFIRGFLIASGIPTDKPAVFHEGAYVGDYDNLVEYYNERDAYENNSKSS